MNRTEEVYLDPARIAHDLVKPLRAALARIKTESHTYRLVQLGIETVAVQRHQSRSTASKRAWITIRANRARALKVKAASMGYAAFAKSVTKGEVNIISGDIKKFWRNARRAA
jgi:hypothetical protein